MKIYEKVVIGKLCRYYKIGEFAKLIGVSTSTLRDYDKRGILQPHHRSPYGYRYYTDEQYESYLQEKQKTTAVSP